MKIQNSSIALFVKDIEVSKDFYLNTLHLDIEFDFGKNVIFNGGIAIWEINENHIIPNTLGLNNISNKSINRFELYFETENFSEVYEELKNKNVRFIHPIHEELWGQHTIRFFDPDNHLIEIGESMKQFVQRFYNQGLSLEEVSQKTFVPVEDIKRILDIFE